MNNSNQNGSDDACASYAETVLIETVLLNYRIARATALTNKTFIPRYKIELQ
jgi:hypothetical protein